jgi:hypothetical protein
MKNPKLFPPRPRRKPTQLFTSEETIEMAGYINSKSDIRAMGKNPRKFLQSKRLAKLYGTDSGSDQAFIGLAKQLKASDC